MMPQSDHDGINPRRIFNASATRGGGREPTVGLVFGVDDRPGADWTVRLTVAQAARLIEAVQGALDLIEEEAAEAAAATKQ